MNKFAIFTSIITFMILCWILIANLLHINEVDFCCNIIHENPDDDLYTQYNVQSPFGPESWIDDPDFPKNTSLLFPLEILTRNLTCDDLNLSMIGQLNNHNSDNIINQTQFNFECFKSPFH